MLSSAICVPSLGSSCFPLLEDKWNQEGLMIKNKNVSGNNSCRTSDKIVRLFKALAHNANIAWFLITLQPTLVNRLSGFEKLKGQNDKINKKKKRKLESSKIRNIESTVYILLHLKIIRHPHNQLLIIHILLIKTSQTRAINLWITIMAIVLKSLPSSGGNK